MAMTFLTRLFFLAAMISGMTPPMEMPARVTSERSSSLRKPSTVSTNSSGR
jgi:hypothetical protein